MKSTFVLLAMLCAVCTTASAQFFSTGVFNAKVLLPISTVQVPDDIENPDEIITKKLGNDDIINLALGRPLLTKVDKKTEVLAAAVSYEKEDEAPKSQLIVYNPTMNGEEGIVAVVGTMDMLEWQYAYLNKTGSGFGIARGKVLATTEGTPAQNGFLESEVQGAGRCAGKHLFIVGDENASPKGFVFIQGHIKFVYTDGQGTHNFDGYVTNGSARISGKPIGGWN